MARRHTWEEQLEREHLLYKAGSCEDKPGYLQNAKSAGLFNFPIWIALYLSCIVDAVHDCYPGSVFIRSQQEAKFLLAADMHDLTAVTW